MLGRISHKISSLKRIQAFDNRLQIVISHLFYPKGKILYVWKGRPIIVDGTRAETAGGIHAVLTTEEYTQFFDKIDPAAVHNVMDLGANVGSFTLLAHEHFPNLRRVVLVEGDATVVPRLEFNVYESLTRAKADVIHSAVCGHDGEITFYQNATSVGSGTTAESAGDTATKTVVPAVSLATVIGRFPAGETVDVCKMDIEGGEYAAIYSLSDSDLHRLRFIITELHGTDEENDRFIQHFIARGFTHHPSNGKGNPRTHGFLR